MAAASSERTSVDGGGVGGEVTGASDGHETTGIDRRRLWGEPAVISPRPSLLRVSDSDRRPVAVRSDFPPRYDSGTT